MRATGAQGRDGRAEPSHDGPDENGYALVRANILRPRPGAVLPLGTRRNGQELSPRSRSGIKVVVYSPGDSILLAGDCTFPTSPFPLTTSTSSCATPSARTSGIRTSLASTRRTP